MSDENLSDENLEDNFIPIDTIDGSRVWNEGPFVPQTLTDEGDGSSSREGVEVSSWRLHTLPEDRLRSISEPRGRDRRSRKTRRAHAASRRARTEKGRKSRGRNRMLAATLLVLLVAGAAWAAISYVYEMWGGKTVPYVVGLSLGNATQQLEEKGFKVETESVPSDTVEGHVIEVRPRAGERVDEGSTVRLSVSSNRVIPEVVGLSRDEARAALEDAGAQNVRLEMQETVEGEDRVLEVIPAAGAVFMSSDEIVLVVSQLPVVPDVVGEEEGVALARVQNEGIPAHVELERGEASQRLHVIRTSPEAGQNAGADGVTIYVGDPLISALRLSDYFDAPAPRIDEFLRGEGLTPKLGHRIQEGHVIASYVNDDGDTLAFLADPWSSAVLRDQTAYQNVMDSEALIEGVRLTAKAQTLSQDDEADGQTTTSQAKTQILGIESPTVGESTATEVMKICGFEGIIDSCTQSTIQTPSGTGASGHLFYCCYGEQGKYIWTVLVKGTAGNGATVANEIVATCAPKSTYAKIDLTQNGGQVCDYVAYQDIFVG